jgi:hypothetical protein
MDRPTGRHVFCSLLDHFGNNASISDHGQGNTLQEFSRICAKYRSRTWRIGAICTLAALLSGCSTERDPALAVEPAATPGYRCGTDGFLSTELFGALQAKLQWTAADLECEGMPRPDGDGARLRFAGDANGTPVAFIIALPELRRGQPGKELATTVTVIEEGGGRFFSTADSHICWTDITELESIDATDANYRIAGKLYCVAPLVQVNGESDVLIRDLAFRGLLHWGAS